MRVITSIRDLTPLLTALAWPLTLLFVVYWFRKGIKDLIASVTEAKIGNNVFFKFGQAGPDAPEKPTTAPKQISTPSTVKWENVANLFWLGNDLDWTAQTVLRGAPKETILHGLRQSYHHISELGLADSAPAKRLSSLKLEVESLSEAALDRQWRNAFAEKIYSVIAGVDNLVRGHQPNFRPGPER